MNRNLTPTQRTCGLRLEPRVNATHMKTVVAFRQPAVPLAFNDVVKTHGAVNGFCGGLFNGEDGKLTAGFENVTEEGNGDDGD
ncbi:hypothetical protein HanPSC8_Chr16g0731571 [Helianthus annuus]|nr:hypothetical protein HanPSC8_Chr16g0731571 [Helianthus annuus]